MVSFEFRAHPTMIFKIIKPYLFVLILPFIRAFIQYITIGKTKGTIFLEFLAIGFVAITSFCGWRAIKIKIKNERLIIEKGFFIKSRSVIDVSYISSVSVKQNMFDALTKGVTCAINTEAGRPKKNDFDLKLYRTDAKLLCFLIFGDEKTEEVEFSPFGIALLAASTSSTVTGLVIGVPIINKTGDLVNIALSDLLLKRINDFTEQFSGYLPPIINVITLIFIVAYGLSFTVSFLKKIRFKLNIGKNGVEIRSGLITRKKIIFKKKNINNICFEQTLLMRLLKKYSMRASIGGYGDNKGEKATIAPIARHEMLEEYLKTHFFILKDIKNEILTKKDKITLNRFLFIPVLVFIITISVAIIITVKLSNFNHLIWFLAAVIACIDVYYATICYHNYKYSKARIDDTIMLSGSNVFVIRELYCDKSKVGSIKIFQTPADIRFKTCKLKIIVRSETADSIKIKNIDIKNTVERINYIYHTNINV